MFSEHPFDLTELEHSDRLVYGMSLELSMGFESALASSHSSIFTSPIGNCKRNSWCITDVRCPLWNVLIDLSHREMHDCKFHVQFTIVSHSKSECSRWPSLFKHFLKDINNSLRCIPKNEIIYSIFNLFNGDCSFNSNKFVQVKCMNEWIIFCILVETTCALSIQTVQMLKIHLPAKCTASQQ